MKTMTLCLLFFLMLASGAYASIGNIIDKIPGDEIMSFTPYGDSLEWYVDNNLAYLDGESWSEPAGISGFHLVVPVSFINFGTGNSQSVIAIAKDQNGNASLFLLNYRGDRILSNSIVPNPSGKAIVDDVLNNGNKDSVILGTTDGKVNIYQLSYQNQSLSNLFSISLEWNPFFQVSEYPSIVDLNNDGYKDMVVLSSSGKIYTIMNNYSNWSILNNIQIADKEFSASPAFVTNSDVITMFTTDKNGYLRKFNWNSATQNWQESWNQKIAEAILSSPILVNLDDDNLTEIGAINDEGRIVIVKLDAENNFLSNFTIGQIEVGGPWTQLEKCSRYSDDGKEDLILSTGNSTLRYITYNTDSGYTLIDNGEYHHLIKPVIVKLDSQDNLNTQVSKIGKGVFSPNGDGYCDTAKVDYAVVSTGGALMKVEIKDSQASAVRTINGNKSYSINKMSEQVTWDGVNEGGGIAGDGDYTFNLTVSNQSGDPVTRVVRVSVDNTPPALNVSMDDVNYITTKKTYVNLNYSLLDPHLPIQEDKFQNTDIEFTSSKQKYTVNRYGINGQNTTNWYGLNELGGGVSAIDGSYQVKVSAIDAVGNKAEKIIQYQNGNVENLILDRTPSRLLQVKASPAIFKPAQSQNVSLNYSLDKDAAYVEFDLLDGTGHVILSNSLGTQSAGDYSYPDSNGSDWLDVGLDWASLMDSVYIFQYKTIDINPDIVWNGEPIGNIDVKSAVAVKNRVSALISYPAYSTNYSQVSNTVIIKGMAFDPDSTINDFNQYRLYYAKGLPTAGTISTNEIKDLYHYTGADASGLSWYPIPVQDDYTVYQDGQYDEKSDGLLYQYLGKRMINGVLGAWDTAGMAGNYSLLLTTEDESGHISAYMVSVVVIPSTGNQGPKINNVELHPDNAIVFNSESDKSVLNCEVNYPESAVKLANVNFKVWNLKNGVKTELLYNISLQETNGSLSFNWDGRNSYRRYVDCTSCRFEIEATDLDGIGRDIIQLDRQVQYNILNPMKIEKFEISSSAANNGLFPLNQNINFQYNLNRDSFVTIGIDTNNDGIIDLTNVNRLPVTSLEGVTSDIDQIYSWIPDQEGIYSVIIQAESRTGDYSVAKAMIPVVVSSKPTVSVAGLDIQNLSGKNIVEGKANFNWHAVGKGFYDPERIVDLKLSMYSPSPNSSDGTGFTNMYVDDQTFGQNVATYPWGEYRAKLYKRGLLPNQSAWNLKVVPSNTELSLSGFGNVFSELYNYSGNLSEGLYPNYSSNPDVGSIPGGKAAALGTILNWSSGGDFPRPGFSGPELQWLSFQVCIWPFPCFDVVYGARIYFNITRIVLEGSGEVKLEIHSMDANGNLTQVAGSPLYKSADISSKVFDPINLSQGSYYLFLGGKNPNGNTDFRMKVFNQQPGLTITILDLALLPFTIEGMIASIFLHSIFDSLNPNVYNFNSFVGGSQINSLGINTAYHYPFVPNVLNNIWPRTDMRSVMENDSFSNKYWVWAADPNPIPGENLKNNWISVGGRYNDKDYYSINTLQNQTTVIKNPPMNSIFYPLNIIESKTITESDETIIDNSRYVFVVNTNHYFSKDFTGVVGSGIDVYRQENIDYTNSVNWYAYADKMQPTSHTLSINYYNRVGHSYYGGKAWPIRLVYPFPSDKFSQIKSEDVSINELNNYNRQYVFAENVYFNTNDNNISNRIIYNNRNPYQDQPMQLQNNINYIKNISTRNRNPYNSAIHMISSNSYTPIPVEAIIDPVYKRTHIYANDAGDITRVNVDRKYQPEISTLSINGFMLSNLNQQMNTVSVVKKVKDEKNQVIIQTNELNAQFFTVGDPISPKAPNSDQYYIFVQATNFYYSTTNNRVIADSIYDESLLQTGGLIGSEFVEFNNYNPGANGDPVFIKHIESYADKADATYVPSKYLTNDSLPISFYFYTGYKPLKLSNVSQNMASLFLTNQQANMPNIWDSGLERYVQSSNDINSDGLFGNYDVVITNWNVWITYPDGTSNNVIVPIYNTNYDVDNKQITNRFSLKMQPSTSTDIKIPKVFVKLEGSAPGDAIYGKNIIISYHSSNSFVYGYLTKNAFNYNPESGKWVAYWDVTGLNGPQTVNITYTGSNGNMVVAKDISIGKEISGGTGDKSAYTNIVAGPLNKSYIDFAPVNAGITNALGNSGDMSKIITITPQDPSSQDFSYEGTSLPLIGPIYDLQPSGTLFTNDIKPKMTVNLMDEEMAGVDPNGFTAYKVHDGVLSEIGGVHVVNNNQLIIPYLDSFSYVAVAKGISIPVFSSLTNYTNLAVYNTIGTAEPNSIIELVLNNTNTNVDPISVSARGQADSNGNFCIPVNLSTGENIIRARAIRTVHAGKNILNSFSQFTTIPHSKIVYLDQVKPVITVSPVYTSFSPNDDGIADTAEFEYKISKLAAYTVFDILKNGITVKEFTSTSNNQGSYIWDGSDNNSEVIEGTNDYRISCIDLAGNKSDFVYGKIVIDNEYKNTLLNFVGNQYSTNNKYYINGKTLIRLSAATDTYAMTTNIRYKIGSDPWKTFMYNIPVNNRTENFYPMLWIARMKPVTVNQ